MQKLSFWGEYFMCRSFSVEPGFELGDRAGFALEDV